MMSAHPRLNGFALAVALTAGFAIESHGQWTPLPGPIGGRATAVGATDGVSYAAVAGKGVHRRISGAAAWSVSTTGIPTDRVIDDIAATGSNVIVADTTGDVFVSHNSGSTWALSPVPAGPAADVGVVGAAFYALRMTQGGTDPALFISEDSGATWDAATLPLPNINDLGAAGDRLFVGGFTTVHRSDDLGLSWTDVSAGLPSDIFIVLSGSATTVVVQAVFSGQLLRSTDDGTTWTPVTSSIGTNAFDTHFATNTTGVMLALRRANPGFEVHRSLDDGATWLPVPATGLPAFFTQLNDLTNDGNRFIAAMGHGLWSSEDDGSTWSPINEGVTAQTIGALTHGDPAGDIIVAALTGGPEFRSADGGATWTELTGAIENMEIPTTRRLADGTLLMGTSDSGVFRSSNAGQTWTSTAGISTYSSISGSRVQPVNDFIEVNGTIFAGTGGGPHFVGGDVHCGCTTAPSGDGVYRSSNGGASWSRVSNGLPVNFVHLGEPLLRPITALEVVSGVVVAATEAHGVFRTTNLGGSWSPSSGAPGGTDLAVHDGVLYLVDDGVLRRSTDAGASFTSVTTPVPNEGRAIASSSDGLLSFAGPGSNALGLFVSTDAGVTWSPSASPLDEVIVLTVAHDDAGTLAGTASNGVWTRAALFGDLDGNGNVGFSDLLQLIGAWGVCDGECPEDLDGDGSVGFSDVLALIGAWS